MNLMQAAIVNGMNAHNQEVKESIDAGRIYFEDRGCGNKFTLRVWVRPNGTLKYLLSCNRMPNALSNLGFGKMPVRPEEFGCPEEMFSALARMARYADPAKTRIAMSPASVKLQAEIDAE